MTLIAHPLVVLICRRFLLWTLPQRGGSSLSSYRWHLRLESLRPPLHGLSTHLALEVLLLLIILVKGHMSTYHGRLLVVIFQVLLLEDLTLLGLILNINLLVIVLIAKDLFLNKWLRLTLPFHQLTTTISSILSLPMVPFIIILEAIIRVLIHGGVHCGSLLPSLRGV